jgi:NAD-dependent SIR2 family protein deacetylase
MFNNSEALLVLGSSLTVFSGYRFVARAAKEAKPVIIVNQGETRGDNDANFKLNQPLASVLPKLAHMLNLECV